MVKRTFRFVRVTRVFQVDEVQAKKAVAVARALGMGRIVHETDDLDASEFKILGEDFLLPDGQPNLVGAMMELADPEGLIGTELVSEVGDELDDDEVAELTKHWPEDWDDEPAGDDEAS